MTRRPGTSHLITVALLAPALLLAGVLFGLPAIYSARMSLNSHLPGTFFVTDVTLSNYATLIGDPFYRNALWVTVRLSLLVAFFALLLGYAFALLVWLRPQRWRVMFCLVAILPLMISEISIIFGWAVFFPRNGLLSYGLIATGLADEKISLMATEFAAFVGLLYVTIPYCFFSMLVVLDGIDRSTVEASEDLGAGPLRTLVEVLFPLTRLGMLVSFGIAFIWSIGAYATPSALGPDTLWTAGYLIQGLMTGQRNWPMAAALSMLLVVLVTVVMIGFRAVAAQGRRGGG